MVRYGAFWQLRDLLEGGFRESGAHDLTLPSLETSASILSLIGKNRPSLFFVILVLVFFAGRVLEFLLTEEFPSTGGPFSRRLGYPLLSRGYISLRFYFFFF